MRFRFDGVEFGDTLPLFVTEFDPGPADLQHGDTPQSQRDGVIPGRDFIGGRNWAFSISSNRQELASALAEDERLASRWHDPKHRLNPLLKVPLSYELGGRWRRVYGRPDRYAGMKGDVLAVQGRGRIECDFRVMDSRYFDESETVLVLPIVPASTGGLMAPLVGPLSTVRSSTPRAGYVKNAGTAATPLKVVFKGPITDPYVHAAAGWEIALKGTILPGQSVTVDSFAGTVLRGSAPVGGMLTRKTRLSSAVLPVGISDLTFGGVDPTGTAVVELRWRNAYYSI
ncbi:phage tail family protein [Glutamicibacter soli]